MMIILRRRILQITSSLCALIFFFVGIALIITGIVFIRVVLPAAENEEIKKDRVLGKMSDGSLNTLTRNWAYPRHISYMQYWVFNYTNPLEVQNRGSAPDMFERGPYSYRVLRTNNIEEFSEDGGRIYFRPKSVYIYDRATSCVDCDPSDVFLVPDIVFFKTMNYFTTVEGLKNLLCSLPSIGTILCGLGNTDAIEALIKEMIDSYTEYAAVAIKALDAGPFIYTTVNDLIFSGYDDPLFSKVIDFALKLVATISPQLGQQIPSSVPTPKIHLNNNNDTIGPIYAALTGKYNYNRIGEVLSFYTGENSTQNSEGSWFPQSWWSNPDLVECPAEIAALARKINGTLGDLFTPFIEKTDRPYVYDTNICRSVFLQYKAEATVKGIKGYRFVVPSDVFNSSLTENCGFCHRLEYDIFSKAKGDLCLPDGLLDISRCTMDDLPVAVSSPHFLGAAREVTRTFLRLQPDPTIHQSTYDIEPMTGILLSSNKRLQLNLLVNQIPFARTYQSMLQATYPILWMNESTMIDDNSAKELSSQLTQSYKTAKILCWVVGVGLGSLCVIIALAICIFSTYSFIKSRPKDERTRTTDFSDIYPMFTMRPNMRQRFARNLNT
uniref:Uncharacterized protein n=1 Tax=Parascaris univalens TaxID=6257 RepID=A0A915A930_PARUN